MSVRSIRNQNVGRQQYAQSPSFVPIQSSTPAAISRNMQWAEQGMGTMPWRSKSEIFELVTGKPTVLAPGSLSMEPANQFIPPAYQTPQPGVATPMAPAVAPPPSSVYDQQSRSIPGQPAADALSMGGNTGFNPIGESTFAGPSMASAPIPASPVAGMDLNIPQGDTSFLSGAWDTTKNIAGGAWNGIGGWQGINTGLQTAAGLAQVYQGFQALDLSKDQFSFQKDSWNKNFEMQKDAYDRQVAQVESRKAFFTKDDNKGV